MKLPGLDLYLVEKIQAFGSLWPGGVMVETLLSADTLHPDLLLLSCFRRESETSVSLPLFGGDALTEGWMGR